MDNNTKKPKPKKPATRWTPAPRGDNMNAKTRLKLIALADKAAADASVSDAAAAVSAAAAAVSASYAAAAEWAASDAAYAASGYWPKRVAYWKAFAKSLREEK